MTSEFKTDQASVNAALAALLQRLSATPLHDIEAINDATWHTAAEFDVDQTSLEAAFAASGWGCSPSVADAVLANCTTTLPIRGIFDGNDRSNRTSFGATKDGMSALFAQVQGGRVEEPKA